MKPSKKDIRERMMAHVTHRENSDTVKLIWKGYLAALMEWGFFSPNEYHELDDLLSDVGSEEVREVFIGYPGQFDDE